jgi:hypothetical protein
MATTSQSIPLAVKGDTPSLVQAEYANKVIRAVNALTSLKVAPIAGMGFLAYAGDTAVLDLTAADQRFRSLEGAAVDLSNIINRIEILENDVANIISTTNAIISSLSGASISANASCDNAGTITVNVSLTIPNIPPPIT